MTRRATFGDFSASVTQHLRRLQQAWPSAVDPANAADVVADMSRAVLALTAYVEDVRGVLDNACLEGDRQLGVWVRAATQTREALAAAEAGLSTSSRLENNVMAGAPRQGSGDLRAATRSMVLGRDLLHTHEAVPAHRRAVSGSDWTPVVSSAPVACTVLHEVGGWTRHIAGYAYRMSAAADYSSAERRSLSAAGKALSQVSWAIGAAQERRPVRQGQLRLLHAIQLNAIPDPRMPCRGASVADLSGGVISTAERLRIAARHASSDPAWWRQLTRETLRHTAGCLAISTSNIQIMLSTLTAERATPGRPVSASLAAGAGAADLARSAWLAVTESWNSITTDARGAMGTACTEAAVLALWTGRLAYADPGWTPILGPHYQPREASDLAGDTDQLRGAVDAAHHVAHTLAQAAEADRDCVRAAALAGRLIVPTRSLPDEYDVPYRFAPAPPSHTAPLLSSYDRAVQASEAATAAMANVAAEIQADSRILTVARAVTHGDPSAWAGQPVRDMTAHPGRNRGWVLTATLHPQLAPPGPVERALLELDVTSKPDLEHAAAIDRAADQLILRAAARPGPSKRRYPSRSAARTELDGHDLVTNGGVPAAVRPRQQPTRQVEFEAGA